MNVWNHIGDIIVVLVMALLFSVSVWACISMARRLLKSENRKAGIFVAILSAIIFAAGLIMVSMAAMEVMRQLKYGG